MYRLYVIPGSHACRSAILMLDHKRVPYRRTDIPTLLHPLTVHFAGFSGRQEKRVAGDARPRALRSGDRLGTVPALANGAERISTNRAIARYLDARHPERPLLPADPARRAAVEAAEAWGNDVLQMAARRIALGATVRDDWPQTAKASGAGRMGYLLYRNALLRRWLIPWIGRTVFNVDAATAPALLQELPGLLDRVDAWIADGVLNGAELNAADFMIAPSLALMLYRPDIEPYFAGRPALALVDRVLPA